MTAGRRLAVGAVAIGAVAIGACGSGDDEPGAASATSATTEISGSVADDPQMDRSFGQLCDMLDLVRDGDIDGARAAFDHGPLHTLADAATEVDRAVASRLLQAKENVEADLAGSNTSPSLIVASLQTLTEATADALVATGVAPTPPVCEDRR